MLVGEGPLTDAAFLSGQGPDILVIDATRLSFATPLDLAGMVATAHWAAEVSIAVILKLPQNLEMASYLQRMHVVRHMPPHTKILGPVLSGALADDPLSMEVTPLNPKNMDDLVERVGPLVTDFYKAYTAEGGAAAFRACSELMSNATEHGVSGRGAFVAVQLHTGTESRCPRLEFAVCDTGVGVMNHLRRNPAYEYLTRDEVAISKAMEPGVSGIRADRRGNGLSDSVDGARPFGTVSLQIRSGKGEVRVAGTPEGQTHIQNSRPDQTVGTWAWLTHRLVG